MIPAESWTRPAPFDGTAESLAEHARAIDAMVRTGERLWLGPFEPPAESDVADAALVVPTSGSTGAAKAVVLTHEAIRASHDATAEHLGGHGLWLPMLPPTHIAGIQVVARAARAADVLGHELPLVGPRLPALGAHFDADGFAAAARAAIAESERLGVPAFASLVPTQLARLIDDPTSAGVDAIDVLARFAAVLVGGAATPAVLLERARSRGIAITTTYGSSETAGGCVYDGRPLRGVQLAVEPTGEDHDEGVLLLGTPTAALGRLDPDGTLDRSMLEHADGRTWLRTTDLARVEEDQRGPRLIVLGRADDVIITGGLKAVPQEIEQRMLADPALAALVSDAVVVGVPDDAWGEIVTALVVPTELARRTTTAASLADLTRATLRDAGLPRHAVPKTIHVVPAVHHRGIGKIDRSAARRDAIALTAARPR